jgi:hypothetical protein
MVRYHAKKVTERKDEDGSSDEERKYMKTQLRPQEELASEDLVITQSYRMTHRRGVDQKKAKTFEQAVMGFQLQRGGAPPESDCSKAR